MQWNVSISGKNHLVQLPDVAPDNTPFDATIDGRAVKLRWQRNTKALFILDPKFGDVWTSINIRTRTVNKFAGDSELSVSSEFLPAGAINPIAMDATVSVYLPGQDSKEGAKAKKPQVIRSQITGKVLKVLVKSGDEVNAGDTLMIIEAMKMENRVLAISAGAIDTVKVKESDTVSTGAELIKFKQR
jgi:biotin carboxyl carrier protein